MIGAWALASATVLAATSAQDAGVRETIRKTTELGAVTVEVSAASDRTEVGLPVVFTVRCSGRAAETAEPDAPESLGAFDVLSVSAVRRSPGACEFDVVVSTFESGAVTPDPLTLRWIEGTEQATGAIEFPAITVATLLGEQVDPAAFRDIKGEIAITGPFDWWPWAVGAAGVLAAAAAAWWVFRRRPGVPQTPTDWAMGELARIERAALPAKAEFGAFSDALTGVVRRYASMRFAIPADRQTSREFLDAARAHPEFPESEAERLRSLLRATDLVKFAQALPTASECDAQLAAARAFVEATRPAVPVATEPGDGAAAARNDGAGTPTGGAR